jgi:hypothetical protein
MVIFAAACGSPAPSQRRHHVAPASSPVSCRQQYETWWHGPARGPVSRLAVALTRVEQTTMSADVPAIRSAMKDLMPTALVLADHPIPHCADPGGLYPQLVTGSYSVGYNAHSARNLNSLRQAAARLKVLKQIQHRLVAETNRIVARNK